MPIFKFAWSEIKKERRRTILISTIIALMVAIPTMYYNMVASINATELNTYLQDNIADITVYSMNGYFNSSTITLLSELPNVERIEERFFIYGLTVGKDKSARILIEGIPLNHTINTYHLLENNVKLDENKCFVEETGAKYLNWQKGDNISVSTENGTFQFVLSSTVTAQWAISYSVPKLVHIFVSINYLQQQLNISQLYNAVRIKIIDTKQIYNTLKQVNQVLQINGWEVVSEIASVGGIRAQIGEISAIFLVIGYPIMFIGIAIIITLLIQQLERKYREIAVMKAIGFSRSQVIRYYLYQILIWSIIGAILGIATALLSNFIIQKIFIEPVLGNIIFSIDIKDILLNIILSSLLLLFFSIVPILRAYKSTTVELLQYGVEINKTADSPSRSKVFLPLPNLFLNSVRYLQRKKKQVIALLFGIAIASAATGAVVFVSINSANTFNEAFTSAHHYDSLIFTSNNVNNTVIEHLASLSNVTKAEGYLWLYAVMDETKIFNRGNLIKTDSTILFIGTDSNKELYTPTVIKGRLPENNSNEVVISYKFAKATGLNINDTIDIQSNLNRNWLFNGSLVVCGIATTLLQDSMTFLFNINLLANRLNLTQTPYNVIAMSFSNSEDSNKMLEICINQLEKDEIGISSGYVKHDLFVGISRLTTSFTLVLNIFSVLVIIALGIGVFNFVLHNINERKREFVLLKALGGTKNDILRMLLYELTIVGTLIALLAIPLTFTAELILQNLINNSTFPLWVKMHFGIVDIALVVIIPFTVYLFAILIGVKNISDKKVPEILRELFIF